MHGHKKQKSAWDKKRKFSNRNRANDWNGREEQDGFEFNVSAKKRRDRDQSGFEYDDESAFD